MPTRQQLLEQDARDLARLGYAQHKSPTATCRLPSATSWP